MIRARVSTALAVAVVFAGCDDRYERPITIDPKPDVVVPPKDDGPAADAVEKGDDVVAPAEDAGAMDASATDIPAVDAAKAPDDTSETSDDVPAMRADVPVAPPCTPPSTGVRVDPCLTRGSDCGLPSSATVSITGARAALTEFQVRVTLPPAVRAAVGAGCDRMVFRTSDNRWAPHFVTDCATGVAWVRVPSISPTGTTLTLRYGGATALAGANSYDDTFDRVPLRAPGMLGAYTFDEGSGTRACPTVGSTAFDAYIHQDPYRSGHPEIRGGDPALWSTESAPSALAPANPDARFRRSQFSLNFPLAQIVDPNQPDAGATAGRPINWRSQSSAPFNTARDQLTVGVWVRPLSPSNAFDDNFQTVVCYGMPELTDRARFWMLPETDPRVIDNAIFNPWAIFFRGDGADDTLYQGNTCVEPCLDVIQYAHITTTEPQTGANFVNRSHFLAFTFDRSTTPHTTRRSYYDDRTYSYPAELELFPQDRVYCPNPLSFAACNPPEGQPTRCSVPCAPLCPNGHGPCINPPDAPIAYPPAPVVIGADLNDGEAQLGIQGQVDDLFILGRAVSPEEMRAYRERRQYSPDPVTATVNP